MDDLISRAAAIAEIDEYLHGLDSCISEPDLKLDGYKNGLQVAIQELKALPAVDAAPVVHAWRHELKDGTEECTNCLGLCPHEENYNGDVIFNFGCEYCPWCGARMDGEADG